MDTKKKKATEKERNLLEEIRYVLERNKDTYFLRQILAYSLSLEKALKK